MTTLDEGESLLMVGAAMRLTHWGAYPGALLLTEKRLIFESPWAPGERAITWIGHGDYSLPLQSVSKPRSSSRFPAFYYATLWLWLLIRRQFRANFAVTSDEKDYHFRVRDSEAWIQRIESARLAGPEEVIK